MKDNLPSFYKAKEKLIGYNLVITLLDVYPNEVKTMSTQNLLITVYKSFICNCQNLKGTKTLSVDEWINKP